MEGLPDIVAHGAVLATVAARVARRGDRAGLGKGSRAFAIDVDGEEAHEALVELLGDEPAAPKAISGSGLPFRHHPYFRHPAIGTNAKYCPVHPKLEFRGHGGLLVMPPTPHGSGRRYVWAPGRGLDDLALAEPPEGVLVLLREGAARRLLSATAPRRPSGPAPELQGLSAAPSTRRFLAGDHKDGQGWNDKLFAAACDLHGRGMPLGEARELLMEGAAPRTSADELMADTTIRSAFDRIRSPGKS